MSPKFPDNTESSILCPECNPPRKLVVKTNSLNGGQFLGCPNYPECHYTRSIPEEWVMRARGQGELFTISSIGTIQKENYITAEKLSKDIISSASEQFTIRASMLTTCNTSTIDRNNIENIFNEINIDELIKNAENIPDSLYVSTSLEEWIKNIPTSSYSGFGYLGLPITFGKYIPKDHILFMRGLKVIKVIKIVHD